MKAVASSVTMVMRHCRHLGEVHGVTRMGETISDVIRECLLVQ